MIWEGDRTEVDYFDFAGSVDVNVVNVSSENIAGDPIFGAPATTNFIWSCFKDMALLVVVVTTLSLATTEMM